MLENLDVKDRKLLYQLDTDCRLSNSEIGKKIGLSKQVVEYRIKRLQKEGILTRFATVIDTYKLGYAKHKVYYSLKNTNSAIVKHMIDFLTQHRKTEWVATCSGKWDIIAGYLVKDVYEFNDALQQFDEKFSHYIDIKDTTISLGVPHWRKEYLLDNAEKTPAVMQGGSSKQVKIDAVDGEIIRWVVNNARMPIVDIAKHLNITPRIVNYRMKNLKAQHIILFSRIFLNLNKFNWIYTKVFIRFKNLTKEKYGRFFQYCNMQPNLSYIINCVGSWDVELDFEIEDFNTFNSVLLKMRDEFSDIINNLDYVFVMNEEKLDYYPGCHPQISL